MRSRESSPAVLATRVRQVGLAFQAGDESAARAELRMLAREAQRMATMVPLMPARPLEQRQRVFSER
jgi:hypothetical protein